MIGRCKLGARKRDGRTPTGENSSASSLATSIDRRLTDIRLACTSLPLRLQAGLRSIEIFAVIW